MIRISIWGDFKVNDVSRLQLSDELQKILDSCVVNLVNFEAPVHSTGKPVKKSGPNLSQDVYAPKWLEEKGFNAISLANNHLFDYGETGYIETKKAFESARVMGAGEWEDSYKPEIIELPDKQTVGVICCTQNEFGTLTDSWNSKKTFGCAWISHPEIEDKIREVRKKVDFVLLFAHAGIEYINYPLPEWRTLYRHFVDLGCDAVVASHPHVPQGWEIYRQKPICYSLGNFCFQTGQSKGKRYWNSSLCVLLEMGENRDIHLAVKPVLYDPQSGLLNIDGSPELEKHLKKINHILSDEEKYLEEINKEVIRLLPTYYGLFTRSGLISNLFSKAFLKSIILFFLGKGWFSKTHFLNNICCESHRWAIARALKLKHKI